METKSMNIPITLGHIEAQTTKHVRRHGPKPMEHRYCDCGKEATQRGPGGWECEDCKRKNGIASEMLNRESECHARYRNQRDCETRKDGGWL